MSEDLFTGNGRSSGEDLDQSSRPEQTTSRRQPVQNRQDTKSDELHEKAQEALRVLRRLRKNKPNP